MCVKVTVRNISVVSFQTEYRDTTLVDSNMHITILAPHHEEVLEV